MNVCRFWAFHFQSWIRNRKQKQKNNAIYQYGSTNFVKHIKTLKQLFARFDIYRFYSKIGQLLHVMFEERKLFCT